MSTIHWTFAALHDLSPVELHAIYKLRVDVFVVEQQCPYPEVDDDDLTATHVLGRTDQGDLVAYARILRPDAQGWSHVGRVVVHPDHRGRGMATDLMNTALAHLERTQGSRRNAIDAQSHLQAFYESIGYVRTGEVFDMDGIPHIHMHHP